jgi:cytochrome b561
MPPIITAGARYTRTAIVLHWLAVLLIACNFALGLSMVELPLSPQKFRWYGWHKWIGITVFIVALARLAWRRAYPPPPPVAMPEWQRKAAAATHAAMYALMIVIPLSGWVYSSATGVSVVYLGLVPLPDLVPEDKTLAVVLKALHLTLNFTLLALVFVHAGAAIRHHFVERDGVLARMLPVRPRNGKDSPQ